MPYPDAPILNPDTSKLIATGRYIADDLIGCYKCHSRDFKTVDYLTPSRSEGYYGGGNELIDDEGRPVLSTNITLDSTGIALYTENEFINAVRFAKKRDGTFLSYPMPPHLMLTNSEVKAIYSFLKTVLHLKSKR